MRRQPATANSRSLRSLALPRRYFSILTGSVQRSQVASSTALLLAQNGVQSPAPSHVGPRPAEVAQDGLVGAAGLLERVGQDSAAGGVQFAQGHDALVV